MGKKSKILISISGLLLATTISSTIILSSCKNESSIPDDSVENKPTQSTPIETIDITFTNNSISNLKNSLISIVDNEKLTRDEFNSNLLENIKKNFNIDNKNVGNLITKVEFNNQNILDITFNKTNTKYLLSTNFDKTLATLNNNVLSIPLNIVSNFYTAIYLNEETISNLRQEIINLINTDSVTKDLIDSYLPYEIKGLIDNIDTSNNQKLSNFVATPTYSNNLIKIQLKDNIGKYKFTSYQSITNNISITDEVITLNNIQLSTNPQESPEDWFTWNSNEITGLSDIGLNQKRIVLPSKAISISNNAFYNNKTLVSVDMSLTSISSIPNGKGLFRDASNIISISLPQSLNLIGQFALYGCSSLTSITIPNGVTSIESYALYGCSSLTSITIPNGVTSIESYALYGCSSLTSITILNGLTSIGRSAFNSCSSLKSITIPDSVTSIGYYAFNSCSSLTSITIPNSVSSIGIGTFYGCSSLTSITMPNSVTSIGSDALVGVPSTCVMNISSTWDQTLATNASYTGTFNIIENSTKRIIVK